MHHEALKKLNVYPSSVKLEFLKANEVRCESFENGPYYCAVFCNSLLILPSACLFSAEDAGETPGPLLL